MKRLLAKSINRGGLYLEEHTLHVVQAIKVFAKEYGISVKLAIWGAVLHDLGKGHPIFQAMLIDKPKEQREGLLATLAGSTAIRKELRHRDLGSVCAHRHELSSLGFLPLFPREHWPVLIELVVAHHKSVLGDKSERGLLDFIEQEGGDFEDVMAIHLDYWEEWSPTAIAIAGTFDIPTRSISRSEAEEAFAYAVDYVSRLPNGWSPQRGLLMSADHFGSDHQHGTQKAAQQLFKLPDTSSYTERTKSERAYLYPLSQVDTNDPRPHTLVTAPTGAGKTDFLVRRCRKRIFYTLPFQASINAMYKRFRDDFPEADVRRLHAASKVKLDELEEKANGTPNINVDEDTDMQQHPGASIKVMTPHQLAAIVFCTPGHEAIALDLRDNDVILDEVHTFSDESQLMVMRIVRALLLLDCRIHIGTATLPEKLAEHLYELLGGDAQVYRVSLTPEQLDDFDRHFIHKSYQNQPIGPEALLSISDEAVQAGEKLLIVVNRVKNAQQYYLQLQQRYPEVPVVLIHSRFRRKDRAALERAVIDLQKPELKGAAIAVATQVVEVSLDISYDRMITEAAPLDALIQRFGRVNRKRKPKAERTLRPIHIMQPAEKEQDVLPYDLETVRRSYAALTDQRAFRERDAQAMINTVYPDIPTFVVSNSYQITDEGEYRITKLTHRPRNVIVEELKIEGATLILQDEQEDYQNAGFQEKPLFEIPVSGRFLTYNKLPVEESGSYPSVLPNERYRYVPGDKRGLIDEKKIPVNTQIL